MTVSSGDAPGPPAAERLLKRVLRLAGAVMLVAIVPAVMPRSWLAGIHEWCGLGPMPEGVVFEYLARALSAAYAIGGGAFLVMSCDVHRHRGMIRYGAMAILVMAGIVTLTLLPYRGQRFYVLNLLDVATAGAMAVVMLALLWRLPRRGG